MSKVFHTIFAGLLCCIIFITTQAQDQQTIAIGLFWDERPSAIMLGPNTGDYEIIGDGQVVGTLKAALALQMEVAGDGVKCRTLSSTLGTFKQVKLRSVSWGSSFKVKGTRRATHQRIYDDQLTVSVLSGRLKLINLVNMEHYIGGVIESESGKGKLLEYYKVQAVISRTYALRQYHKHGKDGFNLCDGVHCQAYKSRSRYDANTLKAAYQTKGYVLVDPDIELITAAFHSNCGGQTIASGDVWNHDLPYLQPVCDTFCTSSPHAHWEKEIPVSLWNGYFERNHRLSAQHDSVQSVISNFCPDDRQAFMVEESSFVHLKHVRRDWKLNSTSFTAVQDGDFVKLHGNGFGHGVGLCQEGAMRMAEAGWSYENILTYYYHNIHLIDLKQLAFFKED